MNQATMAVKTCRILYYGPGGAGKRENLSQIVASIPTEQRLSVTVKDPERQIAFRLRSGVQGEWTVLIQAMDTGQEIYKRDTGKCKADFDGVVFVAHSSAARLDQSLSSLETLKTYIDTWGKDIMSIPMVIQYNKREDPSCLPVDRLESLLNPWGLLSFPTSTQQGEGVKETLKAILSLSISQLVQDMVDQRDQTGASSGPAQDSPPKPQGEQVAPQQSQPVPEPVFTQDRNRSVFQVVSEDRSGIFFDDLRPPIVLPVRIPRKLLQNHGSARIILEIELVEDDSVLG